ncbi:hypothetical protein R3W88_023965 [Solanum pinnatisectum]|uniref:Myb-like domain-containing protein n=1 Tax=Solanum pinnatisectum TaxID=50273 RepID=A0AAV9M2T4_9SOLN|nr:hypothetical protein R3W88_023965 [Solanum pinnatisectum]
MSTDRTCNSSLWTREDDKIFENILALYFNDNNLFMEMEEALPEKSVDEIKDHYYILLEDIDSIDSRRAPLPNYPELQSNANKNTKAYVEWSFLWGLDIYGKGDSKSISRHYVKTRTPIRARAKPSVLNITGVDVEFSSNSQVPIVVDKIGPACEGSQAVLDTSTESMCHRESTNAEQMTAVVRRKLSGKNAFMNIDASSGTSGHSIPKIGSELEALLSHPMDEDNDFNLIFDVGMAPTSDVGIAPTAQIRMSCYAAAGEAPAQLPPFAPSSYFGDGVWCSLDTRR